jgi:crotonobetaine/carnitine-CoA ligase
MGQMTTDDLRRAVWTSGNVGQLLEEQVDAMPDKALLRYGGRDLSYAHVDEMANAAANGLLACDVRAGSRVAIMMANSPEWIAVWLGAAKIGAVTVPINTGHKGEGLAYLLRQSRAEVLALDPEFVPRLQLIEDRLEVPTVFVSSEGDQAASLAALPTARPLDALLAGSRDRPARPDLDPRAPCAILFTSGTTGPPKGCLLPHGQYLASAHLHVDNCGYGTDTIDYVCMPLFHIAAQAYATLSMIAAGGTLAIDQRFSVSRFWQRMHDTGATAFNFVGAMAVLLFEQPISDIERADTVRVGFGAPMPADVWGAWEERFNCRILQAFGMTENALPVLLPIEDAPVPPHRRGTAGRESVMGELQIVDEEDVPVPAGVTGEILTRPKIPYTMMTEYVERPDATQDAFRNCWFHTGDLGYLDHDGYLFYVDRKKDALRRRGEMVSSWELETLVAKFPGISECAVVGVPSEMTEDDILVAVVCDKAPIDCAALIRFCEARTAKFQVPRYVRIVPHLPRTATQRVEKFRLRDEGVTPATFDAAALRPSMA